MTDRRPGRHLLGGALRGLIAESLFPLTALATSAFLTRRLGPEGYGLLVLAATLVVWVEWSMNAYFARPTIKLISEAGEWKRLADGIVRQQMVAGIGVMLLLWLVAVPLSVLLHEPRLAWYLALFAIDVPLFNLAHAHRNILIGTGDFAHSANLSAVRWLSRLLLVLAFVGLGLSVNGAILGTIGASLAEIVLARRYVRPSLFGTAGTMPLWALGAPLLLSSLFLGLYTRLDVFALKRLGATTDQAGVYGAVQSLSTLPSVFTLALMPLLLSTLTRLWSRGEARAAKEIVTHALRVVVALLPVAAIVAGSAEEIVSVFFGSDFRSGGRPLAVLIFGSFSLMAIPVASAVFVAIGKPGRTLWLTVPLVPLALAGHSLFIPRYGALGAAAVTTSVALAGAAWALGCLSYAWQILPPAATVARSCLISTFAFFAAVMWPSPGFEVLLKMPVLAATCALLFAALGELKSDDFGAAGSLIAKERC